MAIKETLGLVLSIFLAGAMIWTCTFNIEQIIMGELATAAGGKYKFLTILNLVNSSLFIREEISRFDVFSIYKQSTTVSAYSISFLAQIHLYLESVLSYKNVVIIFLPEQHFRQEWSERVFRCLSHRFAILF